MNPLRQCSLDQLHTLATALGNAVRNIRESRMELSSYPGTSWYMDICIQDNEELLGYANKAILDKKQEARQ